MFVPTPSVNVMKIIEANALPNIHTLDLYLLARSWFGDGWDTNSVVDYVEVLRSKCIRLKSIILSGVEDNEEHRAGIHDCEAMRKRMAPIN